MQRQKQRRKGVNELRLVLLPLHLLLAAVAPSTARLLLGCYREQHHNASISSVIIALPVARTIDIWRSAFDILMSLIDRRNAAATRSEL